MKYEKAEVETVVFDSVEFMAGSGMNDPEVMEALSKLLKLTPPITIQTCGRVRADGVRLFCSDVTWLYGNDQHHMNNTSWTY